MINITALIGPNSLEINIRKGAVRGHNKEFDYLELKEGGVCIRMVFVNEKSLQGLIDNLYKIKQEFEKRKGVHNPSS